MSRYLGPQFDHFLKEVLPGLDLDWRRHRRKGVRRKVADRLRALGLRSLEQYRRRLDADPLEKARLTALLGVTISRFFRDWPVFEFLARSVWPDWAGRERVIFFSAGCASGEEPYSLAMLWREAGPPGVRALILAQDLCPESLARARRGVYQESSLREVPDWLRDRYFEFRGREWRLVPEIREMVHFYQADFRLSGPPAPLDLALCRNMAYTYFDSAGRRQTTERLVAVLRPGGCLVVGAKEEIGPEARLKWIHPCVYLRTTGSKP
ncbi:MAG: CheR family methyltransferase [Thermodesulfobacteriota bacterium]